MEHVKFGGGGGKLGRESLKLGGGGKIYRVFDKEGGGGRLENPILGGGGNPSPRDGGGGKGSPILEFDGGEKAVELKEGGEGKSGGNSDMVVRVPC